MQFAYNKAFSEKDQLYSPRQYQGEYAGFRAIPVDQFELHGEHWAKPKSGYSLTCGILRDYRSEAIGLQLGFSEVVEYTKNARSLRFTDQIEPGKGFVHGSNYEVKNIQLVSYLIDGRLIIWQKFRLAGLQHRIGVGAIGYYFVKSTYELHLQSYKNGNFYRYQATDVRWNDFVANASFEIHFETSLKSTPERSPFILHASFVPVGAYFSGLQLKNLYPDQYRTWLTLGFGYQLPLSRN